MDEPNIDEIEETLYRKDQAMQWNMGKHGTFLIFHANALLPKYLPLFKLVHCRLMPSSHTSNVTMERS